MNRKYFILMNLPVLLTGLMLLSGCLKSPFEGIKSHERAIEAVTLGDGLIQVGPAVVDRDSSKVWVKVLMQPGTDLSRVKPDIRVSYQATIAPASGETVDFAGNDNQAVYTVTSPTGEAREWTIALVPFNESLLGTYAITGLSLYGGTGPEYGGGAVLALTDKPWAWPAAGGPEAELDNKLTFTFEGVTPDGKTYGKVVNDAGADGRYADFTYVMDPRTDVNYFYRRIPEGEGRWEHDYTANTVTFTSVDGSAATGTFIDAQTIDLGNGLRKTIENNAFAFTLQGTDDWDHIYSDYDKFVKRPREYWIEVQKVP